jgi:thioredoxin 1
MVRLSFAVDVTQPMAEFPTLDQFNFHSTLERQRGVTLVLFTAPACGACRRMRQVVADYLLRRADVRVYTVDAGRDLALTREFEVFHLPAMFVYADGRFHCQLHAAASLLALEAALGEALAAPAQEAP